MEAKDISHARLWRLVNKPLGELTDAEQADLVHLLTLHQADYPWARKILKALKDPNGTQPRLEL